MTASSYFARAGVPRSGRLHRPKTPAAWYHSGAATSCGGAVSAEAAADPAHVPEAGRAVAVPGMAQPATRRRGALGHREVVRGQLGEGEVVPQGQLLVPGAHLGVPLRHVGGGRPGDLGRLDRGT